MLVLAIYSLRLFQCAGGDSLQLCQSTLTLSAGHWGKWSSPSEYRHHLPLKTPSLLSVLLDRPLTPLDLAVLLGPVAPVAQYLLGSPLPPAVPCLPSLLVAQYIPSLPVSPFFPDPPSVLGLRCPPFALAVRCLPSPLLVPSLRAVQVPPSLLSLQLHQEGHLFPSAVPTGNIHQKC